MKIYSFENSKSTTSEKNSNNEDMVLYDLFERKMIYNDSIIDSYHVVPLEQSCRLDLVIDKLYENIDYAEETLVMSNIVNPFSIKQNDIIKYTNDNAKLDLMYVKDTNLNSGNKYKILNINKNKSSKNLVSLPPSVNPGIKQLDIDYDKKKISVISKFK